MLAVFSLSKGKISSSLNIWSSHQKVMAAGLGLEPRISRPERDVLPIAPPRIKSSGIS